MVCDAVSTDTITDVTILRMHVITWRQEELKALIIQVILDSPDAQLIAKFIPVETVKATV